MNIEGPKAETETAKQIIALSTGAVAFTVTFLEKFRETAEGAPIAPPLSLYISWVFFGGAIGFALWYLMALNGNISAMAGKENGWTLTQAEEKSADGDVGNTRVPGLLMLASFFLGVVALVWTGFLLA